MPETFNPNEILLDHVYLCGIKRNELTQGTGGFFVRLGYGIG